ncbi:hypothetical protein JMJ56_21775 [Belnapia sp. T18]|uniref:DUF3617 family protein n=1 Tax=Belnapia arida TaxID=2804533 RepID=A0ABS1U7J4_9PROT|nr:hypothetical protein [Belnapia arida]MBL6080652.1 hypothetical protein [Belnapia arida]
MMSRLALAILVASVDAATAGNEAMPWWQHRRLAQPIPMTVVGTQSVDVGTASGFFSSLASMGFECTAEDITRWRLRRVRVECSGSAESFRYEGGFPVSYGSVMFDRVHRDGRLLGGAELITHVNTVIDHRDSKQDQLAVQSLSADEGSGR